MKWYVICKYKEPFDSVMEWVSQLDRQTCVAWIDDRGKDESLNTPGREAASYLKFILERFDRLQGDEYIFCQANPFQHDKDFLAHQNDPTIRYYGPLHTCVPDGMPAVNWCPLHAYAKVFNLPIREQYSFVGGSQFKLSPEAIYQHPRAFYEALWGLTKIGRWQENKVAWVLERLWPEIFPEIWT
jgi:hypothetical protein